MRNVLILLLSIVVAVGLTACGGEKGVEEKKVKSADGKADETEEGAAEDKEEEEKEEDSKEQQFNEEIVDNDDVKATLISVEKIAENEWDEDRIKITYEVEMKGQDTTVVEAREEPADGKMIDDMMISRSQEISGGKMADAVLEIENYDGDLPEIEEDIEMILHIFSWDDHDFEGDVDVKIEFE